MAARRLSSEERRRQIAEAAASLFARKGFAGVTTRQIARRARVNEAILFRHFPTKRALYREIINQKIHLLPHLFDPKLIEVDDDEAVLRALARDMIRQSEEDPTFIRLLFYSALEDDELAGVFLQERTNIPFDFLLKLVQKRMRQGQYRRENAVAAVRAFLGMVFNFILTEELFRIPKNLRLSADEAVLSFVRIFLEGMRCRRGH